MKTFVFIAIATHCHACVPSSQNLTVLPPVPNSQLESTVRFLQSSGVLSSYMRAC